MDVGEVERRRLWSVLESLGVRASEDLGWPDIWFETTVPIGGTYTGSGRPFGVRWHGHEHYAGEDEDFPWRRKEIERSFGIGERSRIFLDAGCSDGVNHLIMGELARHLAKTLRGVIDLNGALIPASALHASGIPDTLWLHEHGNWADVAESVEQILKTLPGRIVGIPYRTESGRGWLSHFCDAEFMEAWLRHPDFYLIK